MKDMRIKDLKIQINVYKYIPIYFILILHLHLYANSNINQCFLFLKNFAFKKNLRNIHTLIGPSPYFSLLVPNIKILFFLPIKQERNNNQ